MPAWPTASTPPAAPTPAPAKIEILRLNVVLPRRATNLARRQRHRHPRHPFAKERPRGSTWLAEICKWLRHTGNGSDSLAADTIRCTALVCCPVPSDLRQQQVADLGCLSLSGKAPGGRGVGLPMDVRHFGVMPRLLRSVDIELVAFGVLHPDRVVVEPFLGQCASDGGA
jgi:hypothetical protein